MARSAARAARCAFASMKGFPRRGSNASAAAPPSGATWASMKGFPRRGSNDSTEPISGVVTLPQ